MADLSIGESFIKPANDAGNADGPNFSAAFKQVLGGVDEKQHIASHKMEAVDAGQSDDLVGAMLASQEASLSFSMLTQVRNKVVGAMDELLKMPL